MYYDYFITSTPTRRPNILDDLWTELLWLPIRLCRYYEWLWLFFFFFFFLPQQYLYWPAYMLIRLLGLFIGIISLFTLVRTLYHYRWGGCGFVFRVRGSRRRLTQHISLCSSGHVLLLFYRTGIKWYQRNCH